MDELNTSNKEIQFQNTSSLISDNVIVPFQRDFALFIFHQNYLVLHIAMLI